METTAPFPQTDAERTDVEQSATEQSGTEQFGTAQPTIAQPTLAQPVLPVQPGLPYGAYPAPVAPARNGWAIASLVLSIASLVLAIGIPAVLGIVFGLMARRESTRPGDRTMAAWGIGLGIFSLAWGVALVVLGVAFLLPFIFIPAFAG